MFCKLTEMGVTGPVLDLIKSMYSDTSNTIRLNDEYTTPFCSKQGVCQGDNLSPKIFSCYINGLIDQLNMSESGIKLWNGRKISVLAYADDLVIISDSREGLQLLLDETADWCQKWQIQVNATKTQVMHFRDKWTMRDESPFTIGGLSLQVVPTYKYLGVILDEFLVMNSAVDTLSKAGMRALGSVIGRTRSVYDLGYKSFSMMYNSYVISVLSYGLSCWVPNSSNINLYSQLEQIQHKAIRYYSGLPKTCPIAGMECDMGWTPFILHRDIEYLRMFNQLVRMPNTTVGHQIYQNDKLMCNENSWSMNIKRLLHSIDMIDKFERDEAVNLRIARERLMTDYVEAWKTVARNKAKLTNY